MKRLIFLIVCGVFVTTCFSQTTQRISGKSPVKVIRAGVPENQPGIAAAPDLILKDELFMDPDSNNIIDGNESSAIRFKVENLGTGDAKNVKIAISLKSGPMAGLDFPGSVNIGLIRPNEVKEVSISLAAGLSLQAGTAEFKIEALEDRGFDAYPLIMRIETSPFKPPDVLIADARFSTEKGGKVSLNIPLQLQFLVQNAGKGPAKDISVICILPNENCLPLGSTDKFTIARLNPGEMQEFAYSFIANRRYQGESIPLRLMLKESYGRFSRDTVISLRLEQTVAARSSIIAAMPAAEVVIPKVSLTSDVDKNIPVNTRKDSLKFALVIGNEDYSRYQNGLNTEMDVQFARNDAQVVREYLVKTLGYRENNVYLLTDATTGEMNQKIDLISKRAAKAGQDAELLFYYAGHGLPDEESHIPYLIPVDVSGTNINQGIQLHELYKKFGETSAKRVIILLDACFSGGGRNSGLLAGRSIKIKPSGESLSGNMLLVTASSGEQSALPYNKEKHGLFTYFLLKKIQLTSGDITLGNLIEYLTKTVSSVSLEVNQKEQDPTVEFSSEIKDEWKSWKLR